MGQETRTKRGGEFRLESGSLITRSELCRTPPVETVWIVKGSRGHGGIRRALMGSASDSAVRHAHYPVMVAR